MDISKEYLSQLDSLVLYVKQSASSGQSGARKSNSKGISMEFSDFKNYTYGDNIKHIDWNSYARFDKPYIKLFTEERRANINIMLDCSKSMDFGTKGYYSKMLALSLAYIALKNTDVATIYLLGLNKKLVLDSKNQFDRILDFLDNINYSTNTGISDIINLKDIKKGVTYIISDFLFDEGIDEPLRFLQYLKQDTVAVQVLDTTETEPDISGEVKLLDSETGMERALEVDLKTIQGYKNAVKSLKLRLVECCKKRNSIFVDLSTDIDLLHAVNFLL